MGLIGKNFHMIHMTGDLAELDKWYDEVFSVHRYMHNNYAAAEQRDASLVVIGDVCIEPIAPAFRVEGWDAMPLGRFFSRFGERWHSIAWYVQPENMPELHARLRALGVRMFGQAGVSASDKWSGGAVFTHPRDTYTQLQLSPGVMGMDVRYKPGFNPAWWADRHPLQAISPSHVTLKIRDVDKARDFFIKAFDGEVLYEGEQKLTGTRSAFLAVGADVVVEVAQPTTQTSMIGEDLEKYGEGMYAVTVKVKDLAKAEEHLSSKGVRIALKDDQTLIADPATTHNAVWGFTIWDIPSDMREPWTVYPS